MKENVLIRGLQQKQTAALEALITAYGAYVRTIVENITRASLSESDAEEITADVFVAVWEHADKLREGQVRPYLATIARNKARSRLRCLHTTLPLEEAALPAGESPVSEAERHLQREALTSALETLDARDREMLVRYYYYCQRTAEIAAAMHLTNGAVKTGLHRARKKLGRILYERGFCDETEFI